MEFLFPRCYIAPAIPFDDRINTLQAELDRLTNYISMYATVASLLAGILAVIVTVALGVATYFAYSANRNTRAARSIQTAVRELERRREELQKTFDEKIGQLERKIVSYEEGLQQEILARSGLMRELVSGELCYRRSDYDGAVQHYRSVREGDPGNEEATYYLGRSLTNLNRIEDSVALFNELLENGSENVRAMRGLALALRFREPPRACEVARAALETANIPMDVAHDLKNEYALLLRDAGNYVDALRYHSAALELKPGDTVTEYFVGVAEMLCDQRGRGLRRLTIARERAQLELEDRELRPLWAAVILWSVAFANGEEDVKEAQLLRMREHLDSSYLQQTVEAHLRAMSQVMGGKPPTLS